MATHSIFSPYLAFVLVLLITLSQGKEFLLEGHHNTWKIPSSPNEFTNWAQKLRFQIGDAIVMDYDPQSDSILEVTLEDHNNCNKSNPIRKYEDGNTTLPLDRSGKFYFISGAEEHCEKGQKLMVNVLSAKHSNHHHHHSPVAPTPSPSPSPSNSNVDASNGAPTFKTASTILGSFAFVLTLIL